ncbi:MAG: 2-oxoglutarate dehydrogenase E1 component, partial [Bdellovibrionales bacterium]
KRGITDIAIVRVEQLYPFPKGPLTRVFTAAPEAQIVWCQEEPKNQGYWFFVEPLIEDVLEGLKVKQARPKYIGRIAAAAPATGLLKTHLLEQKALIDEALTL